MPTNDSKPRLKAPAGTCDTHMHFYDKRYPIAPTAKVLAPDALVPEYMKMRERIGIERTIVVQPSAYGSDNRCTMDAVAAIGPSARAVVVVEPDVTDAELERLTKLGRSRLALLHAVRRAAADGIHSKFSQRGWHRSAGTSFSRWTAATLPTAPTCSGALPAR